MQKKISNSFHIVILSFIWELLDIRLVRKMNGKISKKKMKSKTRVKNIICNSYAISLEHSGSDNPIKGSSNSQSLLKHMKHTHTSERINTCIHNNDDKIHTYRGARAREHLHRRSEAREEKKTVYFSVETVRREYQKKKKKREDNNTAK